MIRFLRAAIERFFHSRISECTVLCVTAKRQITPHMLRVAFTGKNLDEFATDKNLHVKLLLPPQSAPRDRWMKEAGDGKARLRDRNVAPIFRKYTIRKIDAEADRLEIDFVLHADGGPGAAWAASARLGDVVGIIGPGGRGIAPADWYLLAGDETALPAIGRIVENLPLDAAGTIMIEVDGPEEEQALEVPEDVELQWLHRNGAPPGTTGLLIEAIRAATFPDDHSGVFVWVAAEFEAIRMIRMYLRSERKLDTRQHLAVAYWRRDKK